MFCPLAPPIGRKGFADSAPAYSLTAQGHLVPPQPILLSAVSFPVPTGQLSTVLHAVWIQMYVHLQGFQLPIPN